MTRPVLAELDPEAAPSRPGPAVPVSLDPQRLAAENARLRARVRELEQAGREPTLSVLEHFATSSPGWFWEMDADLRFTWFSDSVEAVTGVPPEWHYGKTREELGARHVVSTQQWSDHVAVLARREPFNDFVFRRDGPDGVKFMRTSGVPFFDEDGEFLGYRGTATDITPEVLARRTARRLMDAVEDLNDLFVLWDASDRLIMCNRRFREINASVAHTLEPGVHFEDHVRAALTAGLYPGATGREEQWLEERLAVHRNPGTPMELERQDGRWLLIKEHRLEDGSTATIATDITGRKRNEQAIEAQNRLLETTLETIPDGVQVLDADLNLVAWNDRLWEVLELDGPSVLAADNPGKAFRHALAGRGEYGEGDVDELVATREAIARTPAPVHYERQLVSGRWMECRGTPIPGGGYLAVYRDVDERKRMEREMHRLATRDDLTGLANRRSILASLSAEFERFGRYGRDLSLLMIDVDDFKRVNDRFGHAVGDAVLRSMGRVLLDAFRDADCVGRLGGEEFAVVLPECALEPARVVANRLRETVAALDLGDDGLPEPVTISIGVAQAARDRGMMDLMNAADRALYRAKAGGRNRVVAHPDP